MMRKRYARKPRTMAASGVSLSLNCPPMWRGRLQAIRPRTRERSLTLREAAILGRSRPSLSASRAFENVGFERLLSLDPEFVPAVAPGVREAPRFGVAMAALVEQTITQRGAGHVGFAAVFSLGRLRLRHHVDAAVLGSMTTASTRARICVIDRC